MNMKMKQENMQKTHVEYIHNFPQRRHKTVMATGNSKPTPFCGGV